MARYVLSALLFAVALFVSCGAAGTEFHIDPINGSLSGDGSIAAPWPSVQALIDNQMIESTNWQSLPPDSSTPLVIRNEGAPVKGGDTLLLATGDYGALDIVGYYNSSMITIAPEPGAQPKFSRILLRASANWTLHGLQVSPSYAEPYENTTMIQLDTHSWHGPVKDLAVKDCSLFSVDDTSGWSLADWNELPANGIASDGTNIVLRNNHLKNVNFGISIDAEHALVENNVIENFAGDGIRGLGNYSTYAYNTVKNCYDVNENHDDGFQSWSYGSGGVGTGEVIGVTLRGNTIINYENPDQPFRGTLQGIGCFDGTFVDWVVENNLVFTDHWHGITLLGARNCRVVNNTVLDQNAEKPGPPWIEIGDHKNGTAPVNSLVRNNLTSSLNNADGVVEDCNVIIDDPSTLFIDPDSGDFHLQQDSALVDAGCAELAPLVDRDRLVRPSGARVDIGAYEYSAISQE